MYEMKEKIIKEERALIFIGIVIMAIFTPTVAMFLWMLLQDPKTFSYNFHIQFYFLVAIFIMVVKDCSLQLITLIIKFFSPYYIKVNSDGILQIKATYFVAKN